MKDKKKKPTQVVEKPVNKMRTVITSDSKEYKILDSNLLKHSTTCKVMLDEDKNDDEMRLPGVNSTHFDYCVEFINLHKEKDPQKIQIPIKTNQDLRLIMEQADAELVQRVMVKDEILKGVLEASNYLQMADFEKRLIAGLAIKFTKHTVDELKEMYEISLNEEGQINEESIRAEIRQRLEAFSESKDESF